LRLGECPAEVHTVKPKGNFCADITLPRVTIFDNHLTRGKKRFDALPGVMCRRVSRVEGKNSYPRSEVTFLAALAATATRRLGVTKLPNALHPALA
jgi:hypothetical protein